MRWLVLALFLLPNIASAGQVEFAMTPVDMFVGESKVFEESEVSRVAIGAGDLVTVKELGSNRLLIMAIATGSTTVHIWYKNKEWAPRAYNIRITEHDPETRVRPERMIRFNVRLVEFRKSALKNLGIDWAKSIEGPAGAVAGRPVSTNLFSAPSSIPGLPNNISGIHASFGWTSTIASRINFLAANGDASTIAEPILLSLNGGEADFHAGGELPLPTEDENGRRTIEYKPYGIRLKVKPRVGREGVIDTVVTTEVSEIDQSVSVQNIPGLVTRKTTTRVQVRDGETIVLAGLLSEKISKDTSAIPGLGKVPLVGTAFSNKASQQQTTELVMFLQPTIVDSAAEPQQVAIEETVIDSGDQQRVSDWRRKLKLNLVD